MTLLIPETVYLYTENLNLIATFDLDTKQYHVPGTTDNWLAAIILSKGVYSNPILYEKVSDCKSGANYKRSSYLPQMVGKVHFLQAVQQLVVNQNTNRF